MSASRPIASKLSQLGPPAKAAAAAKEAKPMTERPTRLYKKLAALRSTGGTVSRTLNEHVMDGKYVSKPELVRIVRELRRYRSHDHALQVMEWMEKRNFNFSFTDHAMRLDLISKVEGVAAAETYFQNLPAPAKNKFTYGTLLNCYCKEAMEDKALLHFKEMEELGFACSSLSYNNMMGLYLRLGIPEKIPILVEEMKKKGIPPDSFTYNLRMQSYAHLDDIEGVEKVYSEMLGKDAGLCDWTTYSNLAGHYVKAGFSEKAETALKKLESIMDPMNREAYHFLITLYTGLSNLEEVLRIWDSLKATFPKTTNISYFVILGSLRRLKDLEGLKKVFEEWEANCPNYDLRAPKIVIGAYLDQDRLEEAEALFKDASTKLSVPFFSGMELFVLYFLRTSRVDRCLEFLEAAVTVSKNENKRWSPQYSTTDALLMHFEGSGDVETANKLFSLIKDVDGLKVLAYKLLLKAFAAAGKTDPDIGKMVEEDGIVVDDELEKLLQKVCAS